MNEPVDKKSVEYKPSLIRLRLILPFFVFVGACVFLYTQLYRPSTEELPLAQLNAPFPEFSLPGLQQPDKQLTKADLVGKPALVNVWATWCFSCKAEHAFLLQLSKQGVPIYGVNYKDNRGKSLEWLKERGNPYVFSVSDHKGVLTTDLGVTGAPETFLIDGHGIIKFHHVGAMDMQVWRDVMLPRYKALLKESHSTTTEPSAQKSSES